MYLENEIMFVVTIKTTKHQHGGRQYHLEDLQL